MKLIIESMIYQIERFASNKMKKTNTCTTSFLWGIQLVMIPEALCWSQTPLSLPKKHILGALIDQGAGQQTHEILEDCIKSLQWWRCVLPDFQVLCLHNRLALDPCFCKI
ncbi:hypothetical protein ABKV19_017495 [Rosa sericea]